MNLTPVNLTRLHLFYYVAKEGSLTKAAEKLNISSTTLSRSIQYFEQSLQTRLFERVPTGMKLTPDGERLYDHTLHIMQEITSLKNILWEQERGTEGSLKIAIQPFACNQWLIPNIQDFLKEFPNLHLEIDIHPENVNPDQADIAISPYIPLQPHLIHQPLFDLQMKLYASESYIQQYGMPETPEDLDHHQLIGYKNNFYCPYSTTNWILKVGMKPEANPRKPFLIVPSLEGMLNAAHKGYGITEMPDYRCVTHSGLIEVLPQIKGPELSMYYIYSKSKRSSKKVTLLYEYLKDKGK